MAQEVARTRKMTTRAGNKHKNEEPLTVVRDQKLLRSSQVPEIVQKMTEFGLKTIVTPDEAMKLEVNTVPTDGEAPTSYSDNAPEKPTPLEQAMKIGQSIYGFDHCRIKDEKKVFKYHFLPLDKLGAERDRVVPSHYVKHCERVLQENQVTIEKNWSYYMPLYEITEDMKRKMAEEKINIQPQDAEIVIDCWEKCAVNENRKGKVSLRERFKTLHAPHIR